MDYLCNSKSEITNACNVVEGHCLHAIKIMHHYANGCFDWLISGKQRVNPEREGISVLSIKYKRFTFVHPVPIVNLQMPEKRHLSFMCHQIFKKMKRRDSSFGNRISDHFDRIVKYQANKSFPSSMFKVVVRACRDPIQRFSSNSGKLLLVTYYGQIQSLNKFHR